MISSVSLTHYFDGLAIRSDGVIFGTPGNSDAVYTISYTGAETLVGNTGTGLLGALAFQTPGFGRPRLPVAAPSVPEPATPGLVALALFIWRELSTEKPAVNLRILSNLSFSSATALGGVLGLALNGSLFLDLIEPEHTAKSRQVLTYDGYYTLWPNRHFRLDFDTAK